MSDDRRTISAEQVAILADRVDTLLNNYSELRGLILASSQQQSAAAQQLAVFQERMLSMGESLRRMNDTCDQTEERLEQEMRRAEKLQRDLSVHAWAWRLFGTVAVLSLGLVSWTFAQLQDHTKDLVRHDLLIQQNTKRLDQAASQQPQRSSTP